MGEVTSSGKERIITDKGLVKINMNDDNFIFYDGDKYRMIVGLDDNNDPVIKISEEGVNVLEATDDQLLFNSNQNVFKIVSTGTATVSVGSSLTANQVISTSVAHTLGFAPAILCYVTIPNYVGLYGANQLTQVPTEIRFSVGSLGYDYMLARNRITATDIYFDVINATNTTISALTPADWVFKYYILQETAT